MNDPAALWRLSEAQRIHLEVNGYVIVHELIARPAVEGIRSKFAAIEEAFRRDGSLPAGAFASVAKPNMFRIDNVPHVDACFHEYLCDPHIIAMVEEMIGGRARVEQSDVHIRRPSPGENDRYHFHCGAYPGMHYIEKGLYHYPFVKALTNLTDLGPDDGGTAVIPGSHKLQASLHRATIAAAIADPAMVHQVVAPAGSTLLFFESLLHSSGIMRSGRERALIIGGYTTTHFQAWAGYDPDPAFLATLPEEERARYSGSARWQWHQRFRDIA